MGSRHAGRRATTAANRVLTAIPGVPTDVTVPRAALGLVALVAHARSVESDEREAFARSTMRVAHDPRVILLRTCHRVELYAVETESPGLGALSLPVPPTGGERLEDLGAARHLFSVATGLDSVVVGEDQILHQLRECLSDRRVPSAEECPVDIGSHAAGAAPLDPVLERLFQVALHLGRETRSWREGPPRSLADVALDRVAAVTGPLLGKRVLVVGAGRMARLAALAASRQGARVLVANRSADRAAALAWDANGEPAPFGPDAPLPDVDAIVPAISARWPLSDAAVEALVRGSMPVVDLSSPPALEPELRQALGDRFTSVDDMARSPQDELRKRLRTRFERLIDDAEQGFAGWVRARTSVPAIQALSEQAETRRAEELERLFRRVELEDHERALVEQMSHRLVAGLLHAPLASLREDDSGDLDRAARALFAL
jgi:glutamyl-tRNA reductase